MAQIHDRLARSPEFRRLLHLKSGFIIPATVFFIAYYFSLPLLIALAPSLMKTRVLGPVNLAYVFALSQFFMAWILAWIYVRAAARFDSLAKEILKKEINPE